MINHSELNVKYFLCQISLRHQSSFITSFLYLNWEFLVLINPMSFLSLSVMFIFQLCKTKKSEIANSRNTLTKKLGEKSICQDQMRRLDQHNLVY